MSSCTPPRWRGKGARGTLGRFARVRCAIVQHDPMSSRVKIDRVFPDKAIIGKAVRLLKRGELVAFPTDTLYGLGADPRLPAAVERLFNVKGRTADSAMPLIAAEIAQVETTAGFLTPLARKLAKRFWPGPLTLVIEALPELDPRLLAGGTTVAIRVPDHVVARALSAALGYPITATSANRTGASAPTTAVEVVRALGEDVALVLDAGPTIGGQPSTIVDVRSNEPLLFRDGVVPWDRVVQSLA